MHNQNPKDNNLNKKDQRHQNSSDAGTKQGQIVPKLNEDVSIMKKPITYSSDGIIYSQTNNTSIATSMGSRSHQEDFYLSEIISLKNVKNGKGQLMGVFDGHGGKEVAEEVSKTIHSLFETALTMHNGDVNIALKETIFNLALITNNEKSGTTLSVVYVPSSNDMAHVAVVGDSPVIILDNDNNIVPSPSHNVRSNPVEREKAKKKGATYVNGYIMTLRGGGLQIARSLGDNEIASILSREPDIYSVPLGGKSFIIIGTDGLFDPPDFDTFAQFDDPSNFDTKQQVDRLANLVKNGAEAKELVQDALDRMTRDNVTAIVWRPH